MYAFLLTVHVIAAFFLIVVILVQRGRGGGLVESFSGMESMFGTKTTRFLTRATALLGTAFLITSISLALISVRRTRSLIDEGVISPVQEGWMQEVAELPVQDILEEPEDKPSSFVEGQPAEEKELPE